MELRDFEVRVPQGHEKDGYVYMKHDQKYSIEAKNNSNKRCNAEIFVDGKSIGKWRVEPRSSINIERPADDKGHLTFYKKTSNEAKTVDVGIGKGKHGLVEVTFVPELIFNFNWDDFKPLEGSNPSPYNPWVPQPWAKPYWYYQPSITSNVQNDALLNKSSGKVTVDNLLCRSTNKAMFSTCSMKSSAPKNAQAGLTGLSGESKQGFGAAAYMLEDQANAVTISMRLVAKRRRGVKKDGPRPLKPAYSTPIPPMPDK